MCRIMYLMKTSTLTNSVFILSFQFVKVLFHRCTHEPYWKLHKETPLIDLWYTKSRPLKIYKGHCIPSLEQEAQHKLTKNFLVCVIDKLFLKLSGILTLLASPFRHILQSLLQTSWNCLVYICFKLITQYKDDGRKLQ